ncbi:MAG: ArsR family transcriptional regulator [Phycisphaeraceae bacterium]|nr:ArsR family transcriptional regulator [Phycisphaeraceae bacterium]
MVKTTTQSLPLLGWMDSLADATRIRLLRLLEQQELNVMDLCEIMQLPQSTVSRHLKILSSQNWCHAQRQGTNNLYRMLLDELDPTMRKLWLLAREQTDDWPALHQDELRLKARLQARHADTQAFFANSANDWDQLRHELYGNTFESMAQIALLPSHWTVADLGCGTGHICSSLAKTVAQVIGIDESPAMLKAARQRLTGYDNVQLKRGDLHAIPIEDQSCDAALLTLVLTYLTQPADVIAQTKRILKPGGKAVIVDILLHDQEDFRRKMGQQNMGYQTVQIQKMMQAAGLTDIRLFELPPEPDAKGPALFLATGNVPG